MFIVGWPWGAGTALGDAVGRAQDRCDVNDGSDVKLGAKAASAHKGRSHGSTAQVTGSDRSRSPDRMAHVGGAHEANGDARRAREGNRNGLRHEAIGKRRRAA